MSQKIQQAIQERLVDGCLSCRHAHEIASAFGVTPAEVGAVVNAMGVRFYRCQLGLFGYGSKAEGQHKIAFPAPFIPQEVSEELLRRAHEGIIACADAWEVARLFEYPRLGIANIIEAMGLKVKPCQLGCF